MTIATIAMQSVGMIAAALTAVAIFRAHPSLTDWRILLGAGALIGLAFMVARLRLPESPRWLAEKSRLREAAAVLLHLTGIPASVTGMEKATNEATSQQGSPKAQGISVLFAPRFRARTLLISLPWLMMDVATYGVGLFTPVILGAMQLRVPGQRHTGDRLCGCKRKRNR
jgi:MFS family permease